MDHNFAANHAVVERSEPLLASMETLSDESDWMEIRKNKKGVWVAGDNTVHDAEPLDNRGKENICKWFMDDKEI